MTRLAGGPLPWVWQRDTVHALRRLVKTDTSKVARAGWTLAEDVCRLLYRSANSPGPTSFSAANAWPRLRRHFDLVVVRLEHAFAVAFMAIGHVTATVVYRRSGLNYPKLRRTQRPSHLSRHRALRSYRNRCP